MLCQLPSMLLRWVEARVDVLGIPLQSVLAPYGFLGSAVVAAAEGGAMLGARTSLNWIVRFAGSDYTPCWMDLEEFSRAGTSSGDALFPHARCSAVFYPVGRAPNTVPGFGQSKVLTSD